MKNSNKGFVIPLTIIVAVVLLAVGIYIYLGNINQKIGPGYSPNAISYINATTIKLPNAYIGTSYTYNLIQAASTSKVSLLYGTLPAGISIEHIDEALPCLPPINNQPVTCNTISEFRLFGTTHVSGTYNFSIQVNNSNPKKYSLIVVNEIMPSNKAYKVDSGPTSK